MAEDAQSLVYTPTWIVAGVCFVIVFISFGAECLLHHLGKLLKRKEQDALFEALQKLKEGLISQICIPTLLYACMLPCKRDDKSSSEHEIFKNNAFAPAILWNGRRLLSTGTGPEYCAKMVPSTETSKMETEGQLISKQCSFLSLTDDVSQLLLPLRAYNETVVLGSQGAKL
ncbi:hypothetical protein IFM89_029668 [Coptis chinensis]|uniref:Uncharacterized protein n=1 Tax=Coptis chinensis TaxID=261450 RepID=A0A835IG80_9MAGN|nr:hypothetical protein IFM89_029668 [Coptis chinensis]